MRKISVLAILFMVAVGSLFSEDVDVRDLRLNPVYSEVLANSQPKMTYL